MDPSLFCFQNVGSRQPSRHTGIPANKFRKRAGFVWSTKQKNKTDQGRMICSLLITVALILNINVVLGQKSKLDDILMSGIKNHVYPAISAMAGDAQGKVFYSDAFGNYEYLEVDPNSPRVTVSNIFDMASVTKVLSTTSAVALLYQRGYIQLEDKISDLLKEPSYGEVGGKENVTVLNCLLHNAGYLPDPSPNFWEVSFGCPNYGVEDFSCLDKVYQDIMNEQLKTPPGTAYVYSDLSYMTLQLVVGAIALQHSLISSAQLSPVCANAMNSATEFHKGMVYTCYFEAYVRKNVFQEDEKWLNVTGYLPPASVAKDCVPTTVDAPSDELKQGKVSDGNCFSMGGICGHAGLFTNVLDASKILQRLVVLASSTEADPVAPFGNWLNTTTVKLFSTEYNSSQSSRALGWTTNDPTVNYKKNLFYSFVNYSFSLFCYRYRIMAGQTLAELLAPRHSCILVIQVPVSVSIR
jgi:CubicO group peptidase (beta-lactamase class C family)